MIEEGQEYPVTQVGVVLQATHRDTQNGKRTVPYFKMLSIQFCSVGP